MESISAGELVMLKPDLLELLTTASFHDAVQCFKNNHVSSIPIFDEDAKCYGNIHLFNLLKHALINICIYNTLH